MAIIGSAIKTKDDVVACISVIKNYEDQNKRKIFIGNSTRSIFVKIKFMNSEDHRFVVVSDNITDEMLENIKQSISDYKERSTLFEEMSNFQFCEHIRNMLAHAFMIESEFDYLRNTDQIREYFGLVHKKSSWKINWKPSDEPLQIIKDTVDKTFYKDGYLMYLDDFIEDVMKENGLSEDQYESVREEIFETYQNTLSLSHWDVIGVRLNIDFSDLFEG